MDIEETTETLAKLGRLIPAGCTVGTTAPDAPWNKTGQRFWAVTDGRGELLRADTPAKLTKLIRQYKKLWR